jgi:FkbM family methyltransferase
MSDVHLNTSISDDLIYDIGMHKGEDTEFYLKKGFRVVAIEANPTLVAETRKRFSKHIEEGRLTLVEGAIVEVGSIGATPDFIPFYENEDLAIWGTVNKGWADRNSRLGHESRVIQVPVVDLKAVIATYGMPYYMKIDIEGCDMICLRALEYFLAKPAYLSFESDKVSMAAIKAEMELLLKLGYQDFQAVEQSSIPKAQVAPRPALEGTYVEHGFAHGCSGLFGKELTGPWLNAGQLVRKYRAIHLGYRLLGDDGWMNRWKFPGARTLRGITRRAIRTVTGKPVPGWYDTHAHHRGTF